jgi:hypothetical protein
MPTCKGPECPCRFVRPRARPTTRRHAPGHHSPAGGGRGLLRGPKPCPIGPARGPHRGGPPRPPMGFFRMGQGLNHAGTAIARRRGGWGRLRGPSSTGAARRLCASGSGDTAPGVAGARGALAPGLQPRAWRLRPQAARPTPGPATAAAPGHSQAPPRSAVPPGRSTTRGNVGGARPPAARSCQRAPVRGTSGRRSLLASRRRPRGRRREAFRAAPMPRIPAKPQASHAAMASGGSTLALRVALAQAPPQGAAPSSSAHAQPQQALVALVPPGLPRPLGRPRSLRRLWCVLLSPREGKWFVDAMRQRRLMLIDLASSFTPLGLRPRGHTIPAHLSQAPHLLSQAGGPC